MSVEKIVIYGTLYLAVYTGVLLLVYLGLHWRLNKVIKRKHDGDKGGK